METREIGQVLRLPGIGLSSGHQWQPVSSDLSERDVIKYSCFSCHHVELYRSVVKAWDRDLEVAGHRRCPWSL